MYHLPPSAMSKRRQCTAVQFCPFLPRCESCLSEVKGKGVSWHVQHAQRGGRGIAVVLLNPDNRSGSVVKATLRPLCRVDVHIMSLS